MREAPSLRLFTALWPDAAVRVQLAACRDVWRWPRGARPVADENLHATLHYIGSFPRDRLAALKAGLAVIEPEAMALRLEGFAVWPGGIAIARLAAEPRLLMLHARIGAALAALVVALDARPFAPHVTMARKAWLASAPAALPPLDWRPAGFALVESRRGAGPAAYEVTAAWAAG